MSRRVRLFWLILTVIGLTAFIVVKTNSLPTYKRGSSVMYDSAASSAITLYTKRVSEKWDFSSGPCLTNDLMRDWVVDIVHTPREKIDDLPSNQCAAYLEGRSHHVVELDTNGNIVRLQ